MGIPGQIRAGDSWSWSENLPDYPAPTWLLTYFFTNAAGQFSIAATGNGAEHTVAQNATATATRAPGRYAWYSRVTSGSDAYTLSQGAVDILPALGTVIDPRGPYRRALDSLEAQIAAGVSWDAASVSIGGRQKSFKSNQDMIAWLAWLKGQAQLEEQGERHGLGRNIAVRLTRV